MFTLSGDYAQRLTRLNVKSFVPVKVTGHVGVGTNINVKGQSLFVPFLLDEKVKYHLVKHGDRFFIAVNDTPSVEPKITDNTSSSPIPKEKETENRLITLIIGLQQNTPVEMESIDERLKKAKCFYDDRYKAYNVIFNCPVFDSESVILLTINENKIVNLSIFFYNKINSGKEMSKILSEKICSITGKSADVKVYTKFEDFSRMVAKIFGKNVDFFI